MNIGDKVRVRHQPDLGVCEVTNPHDPTDMMWWHDGELVPVVYYVRVTDAHGRKNLGYHAANIIPESAA